MSDLTFNDVQAWLLTEATMIDLDALRGVIEMRRTSLAVQKGRSFKAGDPVWFDAKTRGVIRGTFVKQKQKNAEVIASNGVRWTVNPMFLNSDAPKTTT